MYIHLRNNESVFIEASDGFVEIKSDGFGRLSMTNQSKELAQKADNTEEIGENNGKNNL